MEQNIPKSCPVAKKCNGCQLQNMTYIKQLEWKQKQVQILLDKFCKVEPIIGMEFPYHYRNKVSAVFRLTQNKRIISGVYQSSNKGIVGIDKCNLNNSKADKILSTLRKLMLDFRLLPYNENSGQGFLRHVLIRVSQSTGQIMVVLITGTQVFPRKKDFLKALLAEHPSITTIVQSVNKTEGKMMLGDFDKVLFGKGYIEDKLCGCTFRISPKSFYQVNSEQTEKLYNRAIEMAQLTGSERVIDAYCGIGTIGIIASVKCDEVVGVEVNGTAVRDARENAKLNNIQNIGFIEADAGEFMVECAMRKKKADVVFLDPPRAGASRDFLVSLLKLKPKKIVYISCNPETLERDVAFLAKNNYKVEVIQPVDMFPGTNHVETVVLMSRIKE